MSDVMIKFETESGSHAVTLSAGESVLDGLLRAGHAIPNSCRGGACQACLMRATSGAVPAAAQVGLKETLRAGGYFLACSCRPAEDLTVSLPGAALAGTPAVVKRVDLLSPDVARVLIECKEPFAYRPGQFVNLVRPDGLVRSYSLASLHRSEDVAGHDEHLELHVRRVTGGRMSSWLFDEAGPGHAVELRGPAGECYYVPGQPERPILLVGTGTGLAPLYAIARDALRHGHTGPIRLYHGARTVAGLYMVDELREMAAGHANFEFHPCAMTEPGEPVAGLRVGAIDAVLKADLPKTAGWRVFLCGDPTLVAGLRKKIFLAGAKMSDISADAFLTRAGA
ncbi:MAG TPA: 2Fe-2S iron-sulfur cluster-binding protein [Tepidisphaeraceae bacterium]|nr:2Fe-2S iron-sulfur cluster-binding protein [Tepidisphaeraceae bacterium]